jgi:hypothetical protein
MLMVFMAIVLMIVGSAVPVDAAPKPIHITATGGMGVALRPTPDTTGLPMLRIPDGASPDYLCYTRGQTVSRTDVWFKVRYGNFTGYYSAYYDTTTAQKLTDPTRYYGISWCGGTGIPKTSKEIVTPPPKSTPQVPQSAALVRYSRAAAVRWALAHARDQQPASYPGCTWFVTQALRNGGLQPDDRWHTNGYHGNPFRGTPGTPSATAAVELIKYLQWKYKGQYRWKPMDFTPGSATLARPGDIVAYDWDRPKKGDTYELDDIDHLAFVAAIAPGAYPEVAEWGTAETTGNRSTYAKRGWTWSEVGHKWLQLEHPEVRAWLLHFQLPS